MRNMNNIRMLHIIVFCRAKYAIYFGYFCNTKLKRATSLLFVSIWIIEPGKDLETHI